MTHAALGSNVSKAQVAGIVQLPVVVGLRDLNGPYLSFTRHRSCCDAARETGLSLQPLDWGSGEGLFGVIRECPLGLRR